MYLDLILSSCDGSFKMTEVSLTPQYWVLIQNDVLLVIKNVLFIMEADTL